MTIHVSNAARNAAANAIAGTTTGGIDGAGFGAKIRLYSGAQPPGPDTPVGAATLLAEVALNYPSFTSAVNGVSSLAQPPRTGSGLAAGTATWFRIVNANGLAVLDGSVGLVADSPDLVLNTTTINVGVTIDITAGSMMMPG
jgi:hypothetical protein